MKRIKSFYSQLLGIFRIVAFCFLVGSLLLFICGFIVINKQAKRNTDAELLLFAKNCDSIFDSVFGSSLNIQDYIQNNSKELLSNGVSVDDRGKLTGFIDSQCSILDSVVEIFVYDMRGKVFTKDGIFDEDAVYYAYYDVRNNDFEKWHEQIESLCGTNVGKINTSVILNVFRAETKTIEYSKYYQIGTQPIVVVYEMPLNSFLKGKYRNGSYGIMFPGEDVYPKEELLLDAAKSISDNDEKVISSFISNSSRYIVSQYYSNTYSCKYVYIQPYRTYLEFAFKYSSIFAGLTLLFLIFAWWLSTLFSKRAYEPIRDVMKEFSLDNSNVQNEITNILDYLRKNKQEVTNYKGLIEQYNSKMQEVGIEHILTNIIYSSEKGALAEKYKLTFLFDNYYVAIFKIDKKNYGSVKSEIEEFLLQLCGDNGLYYDVQINEIVASIVNCDDELCGVFENRAEMLKQNITEMYGSTIEMTVSDKVTSIADISEKYNECLKILNADKKYKVAGSNIPVGNDISKDHMKILSMCINYRQTEFAVLFFEAMGNTKVCYSMDSTRLRNMMYGILYQTLAYHNDNITNLLLGFDKCTKDTDMIEYVRGVIRDVSNEHVERAINKRILLQFGVLQNIKENLTDSNLSVASLADKFEISSSYLSKQFKSLFGIALLEYIQKSRINEASRLLRYSELSVSEISKILGFVNSNVFIRLFKKIIGTTPGEFKNIHNSDKTHKKKDF